MTGIATLRRYLAANRFMPAPPPELMFCGDGDFRAIGAEFLEHLVQQAGLTPSQRVLDIGCGIGRLALPLTQYLDESGRYQGVDPVENGISWCKAHVTPIYPNFEFSYFDVQHDLYNPKGTRSCTSVPLSFADGSFDLICLISVLTHLNEPELLHYASEAVRLLAPGGRCFVTAFLLNPPARDALAGLGKIGFDPASTAETQYGDPAAPLAAVAFDEDFFLEKFLRHGLRRQEPGQYGHWSGRDALNFQDICIFERS